MRTHLTANQCKNTLMALFSASLLMASACSEPTSAIIEEAERAERNGNIISDRLMSEMYPHSYRNSGPQYLERDFEAGADLICDEIERQYERDICAESDINWRS